MKKSISLLIALLLIFSLVSTCAYADSGVKNVIKRPGESSRQEAVSGIPRAEDIKKTGDSQKIQMPKATSYLDRYEYKYLCPGNVQAVNSYTEPNVKSTKHHFVYKGTRLRILAEEGDWVCAQYLNLENEYRSGWIHASNVGDEYPGIVIEIGRTGFRDGDIVAEVQPGLEWSKAPFVGSETDYSIIGEPWCDEACMSLAVDYQVVSRNGVRHAYGEREIYLNSGDGWEYIDSFEVPEDFTPQRIEINFTSPVVVKAVAILPAGDAVEGFLFRQHVVDMKFRLEQN